MWQLRASDAELGISFTIIGTGIFSMTASRNFWVRRSSSSAFLALVNTRMIAMGVFLSASCFVQLWPSEIFLQRSSRLHLFAAYCSLPFNAHRLCEIAPVAQRLNVADIVAAAMIQGNYVVFGP